MANHQIRVRIPMTVELVVTVDKPTPEEAFAYLQAAGRDICAATRTAIGAWFSMEQIAELLKVATVIPTDAITENPSGNQEEQSKEDNQGHERGSGKAPKKGVGKKRDA